MRFGNFEITLRETIIAILILGVTTTIGFFVSDSIYSNATEENEKYFKATKVDNDEEMFNYLIDTEAGKMLSYGKIEVVDPVESKDLKGKFLSIVRETERYTQHTRQVSYKCGNSTCHRTETYWTWDHVNTDTHKAKEFKFLGEKFKTSIVKLENNSYNDTVSAGYHLRYKYYTTPYKFEGLMYSEAKDKTIKNNEFYHKKAIKEFIDNKKDEADNYVIVFWIFWTIFGIVLGFGYTLLENKFLNGGK